MTLIFLHHRQTILYRTQVNYQLRSLYHLLPLKLFSLPAKQGRWLLIPVGIIVLLCLGSVYSCGIL